jgi:ABC-type dipeptide/oligopeptide/nickel transport system ATPase component
MGRLLEVEGLRIVAGSSEGTVPLVEELDLTLEEGEALALVGESGCGKSLTALALFRLLPEGLSAEARLLRFRGADLLALPERDLGRIRGRQMGLVFQDPLAALDPVMPVGEQIAEGVRFHERVSRVEAAARALHVLKEVGIAEPGRRLDAYPHQLSGGMRQRVALAASLALRPALLVADEPTTALDVTVQAQVLELLDRIRRRTATAVLLISHDLGVVARFASRTAVMYAGRIVEEGPTAELLALPLHPYTRGLLKSLPSLEKRGRRLESIPGISSVGLAVVPILDRSNWDSTVTVEGYRAKDGEDMNPHYNSVSPGYFKTLGIAMVAGREFDERDAEGGPRAGIVNQTFARRYFGDRNPVGYHFGFGAGANVKLDIQIVGVAKDVKYEELGEEMLRQVFVVSDQQDWSSSMTVYVRSGLPAAQLFQLLRREVAQMDASIPLFDMNTMEDQLDIALSIQRFVAFLSTVFGFLATALAVIGLYGLSSFNVARRAKEIGIRMALGSDRRRVLRMVLREVAVLAALGVCIALPLAFWLGKFLQSQLFGVQARDPSTMAASALGLGLVSILAGLGPALRASRTDPMNVLRFE